MNKTSQPFLTCIVTAYSEGHLASVAIESILGQSFTDFELLIVDDGATEETRAVLHAYNDPRIVHIRQANDGLSSARNRALAVAKGEYISFLDADDSRPVWAFAEMARVATENDADVVFLPGNLSELRNETVPFYDTGIYQKLRNEGLAHGKTGTKQFARALRLLAALEPQSANKMIRREFLAAQKLRFPAGLFFEDLVFHNALILSLGSYAIADVPCFTYFRRYARPQITATAGMMRFDAISSAANALALFRGSQYFQDPVLRAVVLGATFKMLKWCEESVTHSLKWQYRQCLGTMVKDLDDRFGFEPDGSRWEEAVQIAPWVATSVAYFHRVRQTV